MKHKKALTLLAILLSFCLLLGLDVWTKAWAVLQLNEPMSLMGDWFYLIPFVKNEGIAFSIMLPQWFQIGSGVLILGGLMGYGTQQVLKMDRFKLLSAIFLGVVLGGGVGNLIERIGKGYVVDFIVLGPIPIFNIADVGVVLGLLGLFATMQVTSTPKTK